MFDLQTIIHINSEGCGPQELHIRARRHSEAIRKSPGDWTPGLAERLHAQHSAKRLNRRAALLAAACGGASNPRTLADAREFLSTTLNPAVR